MSAGRHFLQIPGPTNLPERIARALARPIIDHRGPAFKELTLRILPRMQSLFRTHDPVIMYPASARGMWESGIVNTLSPGDKVLFCENGHFASLWADLAESLRIDVERLEGDWRHAVDLDALESRLAADKAGAIKAVAIVHNETSTGVVNDIAGARRALDAAGHSALLMADVVSSVASIDYRHDEWGVDVTIAGSQKGLMLPPGLGITVVSEKALVASQSASYPCAYWDWQTVIAANKTGVFPYTPATNLLIALEESLDMLAEEGLEQVFARHIRYGEATRQAVQAWGLEVFCLDPQAFSSTLTAVQLPAGADADTMRALILEQYNMSLGTGLGELKGRVFRIGHLGDFNELMLMGTLCGVEMGLAQCSIPHQPGGVLQAMSSLTSARH